MTGRHFSSPEPSKPSRSETSQVQLPNFSVPAAERFRLKIESSLRQAEKESSALAELVDELNSSKDLQVSEKAALVNSTFQSGARLVHYAAFLRAPKAVLRTLHSLGADLNARVTDTASGPFIQHRGHSAFHISIQKACLHNTYELLRLGYPINHTTAKGETGLHLFVRDCSYLESFPAELSKLLTRGADPSIRTLEDRCPIDHLLHRRLYEEATLLFDAAVRLKKSPYNRPSLGALAAYLIADRAPAKIIRAVVALREPGISYASGSAPEAIRVPVLWRQSLPDALRHEKGEDENGLRVGEYLAQVNKEVPNLEPQVREQIANARIAKMPPIFYLLTRKNPVPTAITLAAANGVDVSATAAKVRTSSGVRYFSDGSSNLVSNSDQSVLLRSTTALHEAVALEHDHLFEPLLAAGVSARSLDSKRRSPLLLYLLNREQRQTEYVDLFLEHGADPNERNKRANEPLADLAWRIGYPAIADRLLSASGSLSPSLESRGVLFPDADGNETMISFRESISRLRDLEAHLDPEQHGPDEEVEEEYRKLLRTTGSPRLGALYLQAYYAGTTDYGKYQSFALAELVPHALYGLPPDALHNLIKALDMEMDSRKEEWGKSHLYAPELLALLNHPQAEPELPEDSGSGTSSDEASSPLDPLTLALTSPHRWEDEGFKFIGGDVVGPWMTAGRQQYIFRRLRFDVQTMRYAHQSNGLISAPSLLEQYGAERLPSNLSESVFGNGFIIRPTTGDRRVYDIWEPKSPWEDRDGQTYIIARRGWCLVTAPAQGTYIIRNSSKVFGRNLLKYPAYWSDAGIGEGFEEEDLISLTPEAIEEKFFHFFDIRLVKDQSLDAFRSIAFLQRQLDAFEFDFSRWKCVTNAREAWDRTKDEPEIIGATLSPGFKPVLRFLRGRHLEVEQKGPRYRGGLPDLAFVPPRLPAFKADALLEINGETISRLEALVTGQLEWEDPEAAAIARFFAVGMESQGDLLLVEKGSTDGPYVSIDY